MDKVLTVVSWVFSLIALGMALWLYVMLMPGVGGNKGEPIHWFIWAGLQVFGFTVVWGIEKLFRKGVLK